MCVYAHDKAMYVFVFVVFFSANKFAIVRRALCVNILWMRESRCEWGGTLSSNRMWGVCSAILYHLHNLNTKAHAIYIPQQSTLYNF